MVFEAASRRLLVAIAERDELVSIETGEHPAVNRLPLNLGDDPTRLALLTQGRRVAVLCPGRDAVVLVSTASLQTEHRVPVAPRPIAMAADARGDRLFVSSELGGRVEVLDPETGAIVASLTSVEDPGEMLVLSDGRLAVASRAGRRIEVLDPQTGVVSSAIDLCGPVVGMVGLERQNRLYAALDLCDEISILRTDPLLEVGRIEIGTSMGLIAAGEVGRWVFVPQPDHDRLLFLVANRPTELVVIETGAGPWTAVSP
jgi:hypothetical protein